MEITSLCVDQLIPQTDTRKFNKKRTPKSWKLRKAWTLKKDSIKGLELISLSRKSEKLEVEKTGLGRFEKTRGSRIKDFIVCNHEYCSSQRQKKFGWLLLELLLDPLPILSCVKLVRKNKLLPVIHSIKILVALAKVGLSMLAESARAQSRRRTLLNILWILCSCTLYK